MRKISMRTMPSRASSGSRAAFGRGPALRRTMLSPCYHARSHAGLPRKEQDFSYWYDAKEDCITPLLDTTFTVEGFTPILLSNNMDEQGNWGPVLAAAEKLYEGKHYVICQLELRGRKPGRKALPEKSLQVGYKMNNIEQAISFARQEYTRQGLEALYQEGFETALLPCLPKAAEIFTFRAAALEWRPADRSACSAPSSRKLLAEYQARRFLTRCFIIQSATSAAGRRNTGTTAAGSVLRKARG